MCYQATQHFCQIGYLRWQFIGSKTGCAIKDAIKDAAELQTKEKKSILHLLKNIDRNLLNLSMNNETVRVGQCPPTKNKTKQKSFPFLQRFVCIHYTHNMLRESTVWTRKKTAPGLASHFVIPFCGFHLPPLVALFSTVLQKVQNNALLDIC